MFNFLRNWQIFFQRDCIILTFTSNVLGFQFLYALEKGMATPSSTHAYRIHGQREPGGPQSIGSQRVGRDWVTNTFTFTYSYNRCVLDVEWAILSFSLYLHFILLKLLNKSHWDLQIIMYRSFSVVQLFYLDRWQKVLKPSSPCIRPHFVIRLSKSEPYCLFRAY